MRLKWLWLWSATACAKINHIPFHTCTFAQTDMVILIYGSIFFFFPPHCYMIYSAAQLKHRGANHNHPFDRREMKVRSWYPRPTDLIEQGIRGSKNANVLFIPLPKTGMMRRFLNDVCLNRHIWFLCKLNTVFFNN